MRNPFRRQKAVQFDPQVVEIIREFGWPYGSYGAMYKKQPAVRTVVDFLSRNIAQLNPKVYMRVGDADRREIDDHPLAEILREPNPTKTRYQFLFETVADKAIYDVAFWEKIRNRGRLVALVRKPPSQMTRQAKDGRVVWEDGQGNTHTRDSLVIFGGYTPEADADGVPPLETLRRVLAEDWASVVHRENFWNNAARQSQWITRPLDAPPWSDEARTRFREAIESTMTGGQNAGKIGVLEEGMEPKGQAFSPKDSLYIEGRKLTREEVALAYGIRPGMLSEDETKANVESYHRQLYQDVLGPWLKMLELEIEMQLLPEFGENNKNRVYVEFNFAEKLKGSFEEQLKSLVTSIGVPFMSVDEGRARFNLPAIGEDWSKVPVQPMNVMYGGQPAVTVPTEDPGTPEMASLADTLREFFTKQEQQMLTHVGRQLPVERWPWKRWDSELAAAIQNEEMAKGINANTRKAVEGLPTAPVVKRIFEDASNGRASFLAAEMVRRGAWTS